MGDFRGEVEVEDDFLGEPVGDGRYSGDLGGGGGITIRWERGSMRSFLSLTRSLDVSRSLG